MNEVATSSVAVAFRRQAERARLMNSDLYANMLTAAAERVTEGGAVAEQLAAWVGDPEADFLPLRFMASLHWLVLTGRAPRLQPYFPTCSGGQIWADDLWPDVEDLARAHGPEILSFLQHPTQTNDVRRSAPLLLGFLKVGRRFGLPMSLCELGSSAGLNLFWDRYRYRFTDGDWGPDTSAVVIEAASNGVGELLKERVQVTARRGCDLQPLQVKDRNAVNVLESYIWGTQVARLELFRAAVANAQRTDIELVNAPAEAWVQGELSQRRDGETTVVFHSAFWPFVSSAGRKDILQALETTGAVATPLRPLAWLRLEDNEIKTFLELRLRMWPDGEDRLLATVSPHTYAIRWLG